MPDDRASGIFEGDEGSEVQAAEGARLRAEVERVLGEHPKGVPEQLRATLKSVKRRAQELESNG